MDQLRVDESTTAVEPLVNRTRALLQAHVPLSLLLDLADPAGPESARCFDSEPADLSWVRPIQD